MARKAMKTMAVAVLATLGFGVMAAAEKATTAHDVMKTCFNKKSGCCPKIAPAVKDGKWDEAQKLAKELATAGAELPNTKPETGDAKSWEKLSKAFAANTKAVADACEKKDAPAAEKALKTIGGSCKACHDAHR